MNTTVKLPSATGAANGRVLRSRSRHAVPVLYQCGCVVKEHLGAASPEAIQARKDQCAGLQCPTHQRLLQEAIRAAQAPQERSAQAVRDRSLWE